MMPTRALSFDELQAALELEADEDSTSLGNLLANPASIEGPVHFGIKRGIAKFMIR
jgi:hypothetical protein